MRLFTLGRKALQRMSAIVPTLPAKAPAKPLPLTTKPLPTPALAVYHSGSLRQLKEEENRQFNRRRIRFDYESNHTVALALPYSSEQLISNSGNQNALLSLSENYIIEHANRRVDLFFYTLIAYYRTTVLPVEGHTTLQHGKGRTLNGDTSVTQACHSSFIPSLLDVTIYKNKKNQVKYKSLLSGTHFWESLNSTVELPPFVNIFDNYLENICRPKCIKLLRTVAQDLIDPIEGVSRFLIMIDKLLNDFKQQAARKNHSSSVCPSLFGRHYINPKLIDLVIEGTLSTTFSRETGAVSEDYIQLLLRMTHEEKVLCQNQPQLKNALYLKHIKDIQDEILGTKAQVRSSGVSFQ